MNIHSVHAADRRLPAADSPPGPKRDAILRAAIDVFAERGFFNAQVADVARAAGVAAGTVYLYFRSKDDLLVSIFERSMRDGARRRTRRGADLRDPRERLRRFARAASRRASAAIATSPSSFRWSCASRRSSWSAFRRRCCATISG